MLTHRTVMSYINGLSIPFIKNPIQNIMPTENKWSQKEILILRKLISDLLNKGAISVVKQSKKQFVSKIFFVPKPDGSYRLILNLKKLNLFVEDKHFKIEDNKVVVRLIGNFFFMSFIIWFRYERHIGNTCVLYLRE